MQAIKNYLHKQDKLEPIPTGEKPRLAKDPGLRAVVFDIYGTLMISASGDVDESGTKPDSIQKALGAAGIQVLADNKEEVYNEMLQMHIAGIRAMQEEVRAGGHPYPEIEIRKVCSQVLEQASVRKWLDASAVSRCQDMVFVFELLSNPVAAMPGLAAVIPQLHSHGFPLGIVSNAQFYTPVLLHYFLNGKFEMREDVPPFRPELSVYSYRLLRGKPDTALFRQLLEPLHRQHGLRPKQVLYVGNDMLKDVYTASQLGFKTALFAGDKRSLRLRKDDARTRNLQPDFVLTHLDQLHEILVPQAIEKEKQNTAS